MDFAPYQNDDPETERAKSPPLRSPTASPRPQSPRAVQTQAQAQAQAQPRLQPNLGSIADGDDPWAAARAQRLPSPSRYLDDDDGDEGDNNNNNTQGRGAAGDGGYSDLEAGGARAPLRGSYNDYIGQGALRGGGVMGGGDGGGGAGGGGSVFETSLGLPLRVEACMAYLLLPPAGGVVLLLFEHKSDYVRFHAWQSALLFSALFLVHVIFSWTAVLSWILFVADLLAIAYLTLGAWRNGETLDRVEVPFFGRLASSFVDHE